METLYNQLIEAVPLKNFSFQLLDRGDGENYIKFFVYEQIFDFPFEYLAEIKNLVDSHGYEFETVGNDDHNLEININEPESEYDSEN